MAYKFPRETVIPASSTNNSIATFSGTAGNTLLSNSTWTIVGDSLSGSSAGRVSLNLTSTQPTTSSMMTSTVNAAGTGDAFNRWAISGLSVFYYLGIDNDDSQVFKLTSSTSGSNSIPVTNELLRFTPNTIQKVQGQVVKRTATATSYTVLANDYYIGITSTAAARTITLPSTGLINNQIFIIKDESGGAATNNISVTVNGGAILIDGTATYAINTNYGSIQLLWNGTKFLIF